MKPFRSALLIVIVFLTLPPSRKCANILSIFPLPSKSHDILGSVLSKHLASIGHNVTYMSPFLHKKIGNNFHPLQLEKMHELKEGLQKYMRLNATTNDMLQQIFKVSDMARTVLDDDDVQNLIKSDSKFDVVIHFMGMDATMVLAHRFNAPLIIFSPLGGIHPQNQLVGNPSLPSYIPTIMTPYGQDMTFFQRVSNTVIPFIVFNAVEVLIHYMGNQAIKSDLPGYPSMEEVAKEHTSLMLLNTHISTESPRPYVPNIIQIGGFHLQKPDPLGDALKKILDDAKDGFVYFSFGTNVVVNALPEHVLTIFKTSLGKLPLKVIMKYEDDVIPNQPSNFYLKKWLPQASVLAHPNAKLFITHGGTGGITESLYNGVPTICIPFFGDQSQNCIEASNNGYSVTIDLEKADEQTFSDVLNKVLYDDKFKNAIKFKSELYRDQPMNPMDKAVYWIEHVIKHKGAKHLMVKGAHLPWYQYHLIDVFLIIGLSLLLVFYIIYYSCRFICKFAWKKLFSNKNKLKKN